MKATDIKKLMINSIELNDLAKEVNRIKLTAMDANKPLLDKMAKIYDGKLHGDDTKTLYKTLARFNSVFKDEGKMFTNLSSAMDVIITQATELEQRLDKDFPDIVMRDNLELKHAHTLTFINIAGYFLEATRIFSIIVSEIEFLAMNGQSVDRETGKYIERNFSAQNARNFGQVTDFLLKNKKEEIVGKIYELPDIKVDQVILDTIQTTEGKDKVDPNGFNVFHIINPTFWLFSAQKIWSEFKLKRLDLQKEELEYLELRHQALLLKREGKSNPALENQLNLYKDRIDIMRIKIERLKKTMG